MSKEAVASWLVEHSSVPLTVLKPLAARLGVSTNYVGAALFAGQVVYENQDTIVEYTGKGGVTVGEFLRERSRRRYGEDHPLTRYLDENVDAITEAFEGTEEEARTFAEFYRQYRAVDRDHRLRDDIDAGVLESVADRIPGREDLPDRNDLPDRDDLPALRGDSDGAGPDEAVDIPVRDAE